MGCYDNNKKEFPKNYLESFLNVLSLLSYRPKMSKDEYHLDLLKRPKKLALSPELLDKNCEPSCNAIVDGKKVRVCKKCGEQLDA